MKHSFKKILTISFFSAIAISGLAQDDDTKQTFYNTSVPSLSIAPDARAGGMGDLGAATLPDVYSQYWNPSKYAFTTSRAGIAVSYTPWLRKLVNDIALLQAVGYYKFGYDENQAVSASLRYFSIGDVPTTDGISISPYEMAFDIGYSRQLSETFAGGVTLRYIRTDYSTADETNMVSAGNAFAADISGYNESYIMVGQAESLLGLGFNISNIGTKISSNNGEFNDFLPANLRLGASLTYPLDDYNTLAFNLDVNKLLVPAFKAEGEETPLQTRARYSDISSLSGIFKSFEKMDNVAFSLGAEYTYNSQFSVRGGYYGETESMGNRKYFTVGAGFKMNVFQLDASYLVSTAQNNPLDQTLRFSLSFDMDGIRNLGR